MNHLPRIGMRMIKTSLAVCICFMIYFLRGEEGVPVFSTIAAIICMQPQVENSRQAAFNRIVGTLVGAAFAVAIVYLMREIPWQYRFFRYVVISFTIIPVMYMTVLLRKTGATALSAIVLLSICLSNHGQPPIIDAGNRSFETIVGILVSLAVNSLHLPRKKANDFLFVTGFDGALYDEKNGITPYVSFELGQMLQAGLPFTIATERTPASLVSDLKGVELKLPVIAMDGAVLYDVKDKRYLATNGLDREVADRICAHADKKGYHYFRNVIWQNVLLIYYNDFKDFKSEAEKQTYLSNRRSPYRNYVNGEVPEDGIVVYILLVLKDKEADELERELREMDETQELHFLRDKSETPEEYCHLKIYHKNATKEYMLQRLMESIPQKKYVAFGSNRNDLSMLAAADLSYATADAIPEAVAAADKQLKSYGGDGIVRKILHLYERLPWQNLPKELRESEKREG
ncbi:MAG: HAD hydrolase family protein [Anaerotignum sp.]|nr:HAD hydrolase family protein [Anaerotignum sp.]